MKKDIHPTYFPQAKTICSCKNEIVAGSTKEEQHVEICSACHPFYTGKTKLLDTAGRVNKFLERQKKAEEKKASKK
ncbi:MAG: 50S ribosomal protein L31 [Candidatus Altimarinota bacterium]